MRSLNAPRVPDSYRSVTLSRQRGLDRALIRSTTSAVAAVSVRVDAQARSDSIFRLTSSDCLDNDPSARLGHPLDTYRSDGVTS